MTTNLSAGTLAKEIRRIWDRRERSLGKHLSKAALARQLNISRASLYAYLNGTTLPSSMALDALLVALDASVPETARLADLREHLDSQRHVRGNVKPPKDGWSPNGRAGHHVEQPTLIPHHLPPAPAAFIGRNEELAALDSALDDPAAAGTTVVISALAGVGGIGKTWLALHWAYRHLNQFPDGQLFVDLRGFSPDCDPLPPGTALRGFLDALGVEPTMIPVEIDAQVGRYRSLVAGKHLLIVLDNARDSAQVAPLLPGSPTCTVIVTSRDHLTGLRTGHSAHPLTLNVLGEREARDLLSRHLGQQRLDAESDAVTQLLTCCGGLPLALGIVATRATTHPNFPLAALATELQNTATRLGALDAGDPNASLSAVLSWSYAALDAEQAKVFGLLAMAPGPDIGLPAAANLTGLDARTSAVLRALERVSLLQQHKPGRWRMHDLLRLYAVRQAHNDQPEDSRHLAMRRLIDFYLHTAHTAERKLDPYRPLTEIGPATPGCHPHTPVDEAGALEWFDVEHPNLLASQQFAADQGWHRTVWQLASTLHTFYFRRGHRHDRLTTWLAGLAAANQDADPAAILMAHRALGGANVLLGRYAEGVDHLHYALNLAQDMGDLPAQAHTHHALAGAREQQGDDQEALKHATDALRLYQADGDGQPVREAEILNLMGWCSARLGHYNQALTHCQQALTMCRRHQHREGEASTLDSLGYVAHNTGQHDQALDYYQQALRRHHELGNTYHEADTLDHIGHTHAALGNHTDAQHAWHQAIQRYRNQRRMDETQRVQHQLEKSLQRSEQPETPTPRN